MKNELNNNVLMVLIVILTVFIACIKLIDLSPNKNEPDVNKWEEWNQPWEQDKQDEKPVLPPKISPKPSNYQEAVKFAELDGKKVLVFFYADWCGWCDKFKEETLSNANVQQKLENYIVYYSNKDTEKELASKYGVTSIPAYIVLDSKERMKKRSKGYKEPAKFIEWLDT